MNERIRELYLQAHSIRHHDGDPMREGNPPTVYWQGEKSAEKFAELIVKECIDIAQDRAAFDGYPPNDVNIVIDEIKEHFGVEL
jgi:hypothetical protein